MKARASLGAALALALASAGARAEDAPPAPPTVAPSASVDAEEPSPATSVRGESAPRAPARKVPVGVRIDGGYALRTLEKLPLSGGDVGVAFGAQPARYVAVWGEARLFLGSTENGLGVKAARVNFNLELVIDRLRLSVDPGVFVVGIERATRSQTIVTWGPKLGAAARVDLLQADAFALFARAAIEGGPAVSDGSLFGGFTVGAGIEFDVKRGDRGSL